MDATNTEPGKGNYKCKLSFFFLLNDLKSRCGKERVCNRVSGLWSVKQLSPSNVFSISTPKREESRRSWAVREDNGKGIVTLVLWVTLRDSLLQNNPTNGKQRGWIHAGIAFLHLPEA
jgi:hypothetical protein